MQTRHLPPSSSCSPPPLPPLPQAYEHQVAMLGFLQQHRRPATFCCTSDQNDFEQRPSSHPSPSSGDSDLQSPTVKSIDYGKTSSRSNTIEGSRNRKENVSSWNGQGVSDENNKERLKVRSLSDWLHLVRYGGGTNKDTGGTQSKDSTPPVSACVSTQSSPGPIRRVIKDPSPKPETQKKEISCMKEYQKLKRDILERRFSLPERQLEQAYQPEQKLVKPPMLPTSARDDERHEQQLKLLQQRQQRQQMVNKTRPPLPQQQSKQKSTERELETQEIFVPVREEQKQESIVVQEEQHVERRFDADNYRISKKGDIAIINSSVTTRVSKDDQSIVGRKGTEVEKNVRQMHQHCKSLQRPKSMPPPVESLVTGGEIFRQQMYLEYMNEVAERSQRRRQKVIRLSSVPRDEAPASEGKDAAPAATVQQLENEFMGKVRERMDKLGLECEEVFDDGTQNETESGTDNCYVISGGGASHGVGGGGTSVSQLPKHLQEFLVFAGATDSDVNSDVDGTRRTRGGDSGGDTACSLLNEIDQALNLARGFLTATTQSGVWSPSLKPSSGITEDSDAKNNQDKRTEGDDAPPVVWTPKSAGASPTTERKEFRPISFQSPTLPRKNRSATSDVSLQLGINELQPKKKQKNTGLLVFRYFLCCTS
ncbi:uncharacterized protein LOC110833769 [Zootermopsis nevadensis]|uniref:uncharacterized protein LOC110833769 n=1 Tax=Zootermopsis nevadensis TaxID=136037 RepID=UPI000B8E7503|nr:uncharacterized protein LOC110833769 [Zootermopsis nevadensis]